MSDVIVGIVQDFRYALRQLRRSPMFAFAIVVTVTLAVGATAAMCGILRATLLHPLPYPHPEQLVGAGDQNLRGFKTNGLMAVLRIEDLRHLQHNGHAVFSKTAFYYSDDSSLTLTGETPMRIPDTAVSGTFFPTMGTPAMLGRTITPAESISGGPQVVVLSYSFWRTAFAADPHVLGRTVRLGKDQATVIGVMPPKFDLPAGTALWHNGSIFAANFHGYRGDGSRFLSVIARLHQDETMDSARMATAQLAQRLAAAYPETDAAWGFTLTDLRTSLFGEYRQALLLVAAAVGLVLLAAAVNIAGLQLSRNAARKPELAIRAALGVSRARLAQMLTVEALTPVLLGGLAGVGVAAVLVKIGVSRLPPGLLLIDAPRIDLMVLAVSLSVVVVVGLLTAAAPIAQNAGSSDGKHGISSRSVVGATRALGRGLSAAQIALALVLLTLSSAVMSNLYHLLTLPPGFDASHLQTFTVDLPWGVDMEKSHRLYAQVEEQFANMPGVEDAGAMTALPLSNFSIRSTFDVAGQAPTPHHDSIVAEGRDFTPGYLRALRIPLLSGRTFTQRDADAKAPPVLMINHALAAKYFANTNPVGKHLNASYEDLQLPPGSNGTLDAGEIVGVIGDVHGTGGALDGPVQPEVYRPEKGGWPHMQFALRMKGAASDPGFESRIRSIVIGIDATASPGHFATLAGTRDKLLTEPRLNAGLLTAFAGLSLLLVAIGVYGLVAFDVAQRTRELGLRLALGSTRGGVLRLLLGESARILAVGVVLGITGSLAASRLLAAAIAGPQSKPILLLLGSVVVLVVAVLAATLVPASRAAAGDPMQALRAE